MSQVQVQGLNSWLEFKFKIWTRTRLVVTLSVIFYWYKLPLPPYFFFAMLSLVILTWLKVCNNIKEYKETSPFRPMSTVQF